jgi:hypothetical protein
MQTRCATAVLHKKYQNSSDFMQEIVQIFNSTIHGQPVAQQAMLRNMIDREWAPQLIVQPRGNVNGIIFCSNLCCTKHFCAT